MIGFITERDFNEVEVEFPGIAALYRGLRVKPHMFLELLRIYLAAADGSRAVEDVPALKLGTFDRRLRPLHRQERLSPPRARQ